MYAAIWIPQPALQSVLRAEAFAPDACVAILRETSQRSLIYEANARAREAGVCAGQSVSQALAKCRHLQLRPRKPLAEKATRHTLFHCLYSLTPRIEASSESVHLLDLRGLPSAQLPERIQQQLQQLHELGFAVRIGVAATPDWARYAAHCADPLLWVHDPKQVFKTIPMESAVEDERLLSILQQWGIRCLADYAQLPQQAIAERLGKAGLSLWRSLNDPSPRLLRIEELPPEFKASMELEFEIESLEPLHFVIQRLLEQLVLELTQSLLKAQVLRLQLDLADQTHHRKAFKLPEPTRNHTKLTQVLHSHLENLQTLAPIVAITLEVVPSDAADPQSQLFQQQIQDPWQFSSTLHQLLGLVGSDNVGTPVLKDSHDPDAFSLQALNPSLNALPEGFSNAPNPSPSLKLQRFRPPLRVRVQGSRGQPVRIASSTHSNSDFSGNISSLRGPWHCSGTWWDHRHWKRLEWDVQLESGPLLRLLYTQGQWFLEGAYG